MAKSKRSTRSLASIERDPLDTGGEVQKALESAENGKKKQTPAGKEEKKKREEELKTQGRAGCKAPRVNLAMTTENYTFVHTMAKLSGRSIAQYVNLIITQYREGNPELYEKAREIVEGMEGKE